MGIIPGSFERYTKCWDRWIYSLSTIQNYMSRIIYNRGTGYHPDAIVLPEAPLTHLISVQFVQFDFIGHCLIAPLVIVELPVDKEEDFEFKVEIVDPIIPVNALWQRLPGNN